MDVSEAEDESRALPAHTRDLKSDMKQSDKFEDEKLTGTTSSLSALQR